MKEIDKYYKPEINEFCVGFEFEEFFRSRYVHRVINSQKELFELINPTNLSLYSSLVKYLDKEDIESLGWKFTGKSIDIWFQKETSIDLRSWTSYKAQIDYGIHDKRMVVEVYDAPDWTKVFQGTIKNKSELIKLMHQLGIK